MHSAIVVVKMPKETPSGHDRWLAFCAAISALQVNDAVVRLGENTWQLDFQQDPGALALLIGACDSQKLSYGILPLDAAPQWKVSIPFQRQPATRSAPLPTEPARSELRPNKS
jgi:hypothetical protein